MKHFSTLTTLCVFVWWAAVVAAEPSEPVSPPDKSDDPRSVAEQILEFRRDLEQDSGKPEAFRLRAGDADLRRELQRLASQDKSDSASKQTSRAERRKPASTQKRLLREVAFQLDTMAHRLETHELYQHADDLRSAATRLRHEARHAGGLLPMSDRRIRPQGEPIPILPPLSPDVD